jgi:hypothetical protein
MKSRLHSTLAHLATLPPAEADRAIPTAAAALNRSPSFLRSALLAIRQGQPPDPTVARVHQTLATLPHGARASFYRSTGISRQAFHHWLTGATPSLASRARMDKWLAAQQSPSPQNQQ